MRLFRPLYLIAGVLCLFAAILLSIIFTFTIGNEIALIVGILFLGLYWIYPRINNFYQRLLNGLLIGWGIYMISMFFFIGNQGTKNTTTFTEDCALVLGSGLRGEKILPTLQYRLDKCLEYMQHNPKALIIVSGGLGRGETICESEAMKSYLVSKGIDAGKITEENQSKNTRQNMLYSKIIIDSLFPSGNYTVVCITSDFHAYRANKLSQAVKLPVSHYNAKTVWYLYPAAYCRETLSIIKMWMGF
jgi:uncharacterized SAM-binding protein YcdF (DUF218 family)